MEIWNRGSASPYSAANLTKRRKLGTALTDPPGVQRFVEQTQEPNICSRSASASQFPTFLDCSHVLLQLFRLSKCRVFIEGKKIVLEIPGEEFCSPLYFLWSFHNTRCSLDSAF